MIRSLIAFAALLFASPLLAQEPQWKAGFGKSNITPAQPMWMSGYSSREAPAEGKETDLWAKAAVLDAGGKRLVLVTNLQPVKLRGIESQGMILAAEDESGILSLITLDRDLPDGSEVR